MEIIFIFDVSSFMFFWLSLKIVNVHYIDIAKMVWNLDSNCDLRFSQEFQDAKQPKTNHVMRQIDTPRERKPALCGRML